MVIGESSIAAPGGDATVAIRVLLVDNQPLFIEGIVATVRGERDIEVVGTATNAQDVMAKCIALRPDVILMEVMMAEAGGIATIQTVRQRCPSTQVLILTTRADLVLFRKAAEAGAIGYILKNISATNLVNAIRAVHAGRTMISPTIAGDIMYNFFNGNKDPFSYRGIKGVTEREVEVLSAVAEGLSDKEIAAKLFLSESTVKSHLRAIYHKLHLRNRAQAASFAMEHNLHY